MSDPDLRYHRVISHVRENYWAIRLETLATIMDVLTYRSAGHTLTREEIRARLPEEVRARGVGMSVVAYDDDESADERQERRARAGGGPSPKGSVAVVPMHGVIAQRASIFSDTSSSGCGLDLFVKRVREAEADAGVGTIVLHCDTPGGTVAGVPEAAAELQRVRGNKRIVAVVDALCASAGYWLASQADEIVVTPSGLVGSIGVYTAHQDVSKMLEQMGVTVSLISAGKFKVEGNPYGALGDEARAAIQGQVDTYYGMFVDGVAAGRGVKAKAVREGFGQGRVVTAKAAVAEGMADKIGTLEQTINRYLGKGKGGAGTKTSAVAIHAPEETQAEDQPAALEAAEAGAGAATGAAPGAEGSTPSPSTLSAAAVHPDVRRHRLRLLQHG